MPQLFSNAAKSTLNAGVLVGDTTLTLADNGAAFPVADRGTGTSGDWFKAVLDDGSNLEIVYVRTHTSGSTTFSDVLRGQEGTTAFAFNAGATVGLRLTSQDFALLQSEKVVPTVADLKAANLSVGDFVSTLGYYAPGDGGATLYEIVAAGTGTQDGGSLITLNNTRQARAKFPGNVVRLSQFGATGVYHDPRTVPDSTGSWTNEGAGSYRLQWSGGTYTPLTFNTVIGATYYLTLVRKSAIPGIVDYDLDVQQASGTTIGKIAMWGGVNTRAPATGLTTATGTSIKITPLMNPIDVTLGDFLLYRADSDIAAFNAAIAWFGTSKTGRLIIDTMSYLYTASALTVPSNVDLEFVSPGTLRPTAAMTINSQLIADNRAILPKYASVTFGPRQHSVKSNWFGL